MNTLPNWLEKLKQTLPCWIDRVADSSGPGRYRFALDAYEPLEIDSSHLMHNILSTLHGNISAGCNDGQRQQWINYLLGLQRKEDGMLIDPGLERHVITEHPQPTELEIFNIRRWTTRNALLTVMDLGGKPRYPIAHQEVFADPDELIGFIEKLDWQHPWAAGSRTGGIILFYHFNRLVGDAHAESLIDAAVNWLATHQDPRTGAWLQGNNVPLHQQINGIMKIWIQVLPVTHLPVQYPKQIIDTCLKGLRQDPFLTQQFDACSLFDVAFVLDIALSHCDHRQEEVADMARQLLPRFETFIRDDGALSYFSDRCLDNHGNLQLAKVCKQSDVAGTALHCHAIALLARLGGLAKELGWTPLTQWRQHRPIKSTVLQ